MPAVFRNDPAPSDVPRPGDGSVLIAERHVAGSAVRYTGPDDDRAMVDFLGGSLLLVGGRLYREWPGGELSPVRLTVGAIYVKPMAGDWYELTCHELTTQHSVVDELPDAFTLNVASDLIVATFA